ncbi:PKD domain-containing protein [Herbivorax sp. ANBcel31]|uniref:PKD domain-containing protein n=1 Tax=Herbivorax sp. ANBcel31 TaxID=3069754 RepID=UPI0027B7AB7A|nr:PKD domain-containing protein [Herbivorax sp. ANBcel31]MDQ2086108.1 PKD domain-containing protein [Herbivorax sp. ANBcel31]
MNHEKLEKLLKKINSKEILPSEELVVCTKEKVLEELDLIDNRKAGRMFKKATHKKTIIKFVQFLTVASSIFILIFLLHSVIPDEDIYAYIDVDINPSFEMIVDSNNIVIKTMSFNDNAKEFLKNLNIKNKSLDRAMEEILEKSINMDLISYKSNEVIITACLAERYVNEKKEEKNLKRILDNLKTWTSKYQDSQINFHTIMVSSEVYKNARQNNISMSKYVLFEELEKRGLNYNIEDIKSKDITYMINKLTKRGEDNTKEKIKPTASFSYTPKEVTIGDIVNFDATNSHDFDGDIIQYSWDFGDGVNGFGEVVAHKYTEPGDYLVKLSVTNKLGLTTTYKKKVTVKLCSSNNVKINWEDGSTEGFITNNNLSSISNTTKKYYDGNRSLKWDITASESETLGIGKDLYTIIPSGSKVTFRIWVPSGAPIRAIQPYVMPFEGDYENIKWYSSWKRYGNIKKDAWNEFTINLPTDLDMTLEQQIGIQCVTIGEGSFSIYIDLIEW